MVAPLHGQNTAAARMFAATDAAPAAAAASPAGSGAAASSVSTATVDLGKLRDNLAAKQKQLESLQKLLDTKSFAINMGQKNFLTESTIADKDSWDGYDGYFACKDGKVVATEKGAAEGLVIENGELKGYPRSWWRTAQGAFDQAKAYVKKSLDVVKARVDRLEAEIKDLEEKIAEEEGSGYGILDCLLFPFTFTWKVVTTIGSFIYDLICCNYGSEEGEAATESSETPEA